MNKYFQVLSFLAILISIFLFYYLLRDVPIRIWDEAIYSNNAIEMAQSHNYFILTNNGVPSHYNTKPPMVIWFESISIKLFGINEFAIRFPSMLALTGTVIGLIYFLRRNRQPIGTQLATIFVLLTSPGYMGPHVVATGDPDAILTMWTTFLALVTFDLVFSNYHKQQKKIWLAGLFFLCAFFTKSTAALLVLPGLFIVIILFGKATKIICNKDFFIITTICIILIAAYYITVNNAVPGYFKNSWHSEVERFYSNIMPWHNHPRDFYFQNLRERFWFWVFFIIPSLLFPLVTENTSAKKLFWSALIYCISFLLVISIPPVKLEFYDAQIYPLLSLAMGLAINGLYTFIKKNAKQVLSNVFFILLAGIYFLLFWRIVNINAHPVLLPQEVEGAFVKEVFKDFKPHNAKVLMAVEFPEHYDQLNFYRKKYATEYKSNIAIVASVKNLFLNDTVFVCQQQNKDSLFLYQVDTLRKKEDCLLLKIKGRKF